MAEAKFTIKKEKKSAALEALKKLGNGSNDPRAHGNGYFSWMNDTDPDQWDSIKEAMSEWRYPVQFDKEGNVVGIGFNGEKMGQEEFMFQTIAPFVEAGSCIHMRGEDGSQWRWEFDGKTMKEKQGKVSFED
jgi:hypothetical protein